MIVGSQMARPPDEIILSAQSDHTVCSIFNKCCSLKIGNFEITNRAKYTNKNEILNIKENSINPFSTNVVKLTVVNSSTIM